jgi:hypothetical protein
MSFDTADLAQMEQSGTLGDVITHEMGHVLGIGTTWSKKGFLNSAGTSNPTFVGQRAQVEYGTLRGTGPTPVSVENTGGSGTRDSHWRETIFGSELMTGFVANAVNPISRITVGSLEDLGYVVDMNAAEPYNLPTLLEVAEAGLLTPHVAPINIGTMLGNVPIVLPEESLQ